MIPKTAPKSKLPRKITITRFQSRELLATTKDNKVIFLRIEMTKKSNEKEEEEEVLVENVMSVFVYGSLRPDDDSKMPWTFEATRGMIGQKAFVKNACLYRDQYACAVLSSSDDHVNDDDDNNNGNIIIGWVLTCSDPNMWKEKLNSFDRIEGYNEDNPSRSLYMRSITSDVYLLDEIYGDDENIAIGESGDQITAYIYHRDECDKTHKIPSGDWLLRER